jgi:hypothetical protein
MHRDHLPILDASKRVGTENYKRFDGKLSQCAHPIAENSIQTNAVKINRVSPGHVGPLLAGLRQ